MQFVITLYTILDQTVKFAPNLVILARNEHNNTIFIALNLSKLELFYLGEVKLVLHIVNRVKSNE